MKALGFIFMREKPFQNQDELDAYFNHDLIQCLECGKTFKNLSKHLKTHSISISDYKEKWGIPAGAGLAGKATREKLASQALKMWRDGTLDDTHLKEAAKKIDYSIRSPKTVLSKKRHCESLAKTKPWNKNKIPDGGKRLDGRSADRAREYQRAYRALKIGDSKPMDEYKEKYQ